MDGTLNLPQTALAVNPLATPVDHTLDFILKKTKQRGYCWAHNDYIAEQRGLSVRTITRHVKALVEAGKLVWRRVGNERFLFPAESSRCLPDVQPESSIESIHRESATEAPPMPPTAAAAPSVDVLPDHNSPDEKETRRMITALTSIKIDWRCAARLVEEHADICGAWISYIPKLKEKVLTNLAGYVRRCIESGNLPPHLEVQTRYVPRRREIAVSEANISPPPADMVAELRQKLRFGH